VAEVFECVLDNKGDEEGALKIWREYLSTKEQLIIQEEEMISASKLLMAVQDNPCSICLDVFEKDSNIIFCSNEVSPHCFHQECSLDYLCSHVDGVQAPCPLCRKPFMYTNMHQEEAQGGRNGGSIGNGNGEDSLSSSHHSSVSLKDLLESRDKKEGNGIISMSQQHPSSLSLTDLLEAKERGISITSRRHSSSVSLTDLLEAAKSEENTADTVPTEITI